MLLLAVSALLPSSAAALAGLSPHGLQAAKGAQRLADETTSVCQVEGALSDVMCMDCMQLPWDDTLAVWSSD